jgi:hypothetical protein
MMAKVLQSNSGAGGGASEDAGSASVEAANGPVTGDARNLVTVQRPGAGETLVVRTEAGLLVVLEFNPAAATFALDGDDFMLTLEDGARVVFQGLVSAARGDDAPRVQVAGIDIGADLLVDQAQAMARGAEDEPIETAAGEENEGEGAASAGGSHYEDTFGDLVAGLIKQGVIGEVDLGFGLIGDGGTELVIDAEFLSEGYLPSGGFSSSSFDFASQGAPSPPSFDPSGSAGPGSPPSGAPVPGLGASEIDVPLAPLSVNSINIITNQATGNLQIPDELILYLTDGSRGQGLSVSGPAHGGAADDAYIWDVPGPVALSANTWANHVNDHVNYHIGNANPVYNGSFTYEVTNQLGASGQNTIGIENYATAKAGSYWTLNGTGADEVLLGLDGRNQIDGGGGDDVIHGGHDASGDILSGGDGNDVIFGGSGNDDLQGGNGDDTFIMSAGFSRDDVRPGLYP